jgi:hypothetical protein
MLQLVMTFFATYHFPKSFDKYSMKIFSHYLLIKLCNFKITFPKPMTLPIAKVDETVVADARPIAMPYPIQAPAE